jgi:hypothetical protein
MSTRFRWRPGVPECDPDVLTGSAMDPAICCDNEFERKYEGIKASEVVRQVPTERFFLQRS